MANSTMIQRGHTKMFLLKSLAIKENSSQESARREV